MPLGKFLTGWMVSLIPYQAPEQDGLFNRRRLAYFGLIFTVYWSHLVLLVYVFGPPPDAVSITAFLGVPSSIAGMGFYKYLKAAESDDASKTITNVGYSSGDRVAFSSTELPNQQNNRVEGEQQEFDLSPRN